MSGSGQNTQFRRSCRTERDESQRARESERPLEIVITWVMCINVGKRKEEGNMDRGREYED